MELLKRESAESLDAKEHLERYGKLHEGHQKHGQHSHARLLIHAVLLKRDALHADLVARLVRPVELFLELKQPRMSAAELRSCLVENGTDRSRERSMPATIVWNQGSPETFRSSSSHEDSLAKDHTASPRAARSPPHWTRPGKDERKQKTWSHQKKLHKQGEAKVTVDSSDR